LFLVIKRKNLLILARWSAVNSFGITEYRFTSIRYPKMWPVDPPVSSVALGLLNYQFTVAVTARKRSS